jgi:putative ABC transport system substrate-binding protein
MRRRDFIAGLGGAAVALPLAARAQQVERMRRIGVLILAESETDPDAQARFAAFREGLAKLDWIDGRNLRIDVRFGGINPDRLRADAEALVSLAPDVIVAGSAAATAMVQNLTRIIPIVFAGGNIEDGNIVKNIVRPEGNVTGFTNLYASISSKWLELLKEVAPRVTRAALIFNPDLYPGGVLGNYFPPIEAAAPVLGVQVIRTPVHNGAEIERAIDAFAAASDGGLVVMPPPSSGRETIIRLAAQQRLPAVYSVRSSVTAGGLIAYCQDPMDNYRRAPSYVDRILRGAKPGDLPVQFPTKFELAINLKTAKAIGLEIPPTLLGRADVVIE